METVYGGRAKAYAAEIGRHYHRSASLPGGERGVPFCLEAADQGHAAAAFDEVVIHLRAALDLLPVEASERPHLLGRLALALWALRDEEAERVTSEALRLIAQTEGAQAASVHALAVTAALAEAGFMKGAWEVAAKGLPYTEGRRDLTWAFLMHYDALRREASDPDNPGMMLDSPERREIFRIYDDLEIRGPIAHWARCREDLLARSANVAFDRPALVTILGGEVRQGPALWTKAATAALRQGLLARAATCHAALGHCHLALGNFADAAAAYERCRSLADRFAGRAALPIEHGLATHARRLMLDIELDRSLEELEESGPLAPEFYFYGALSRGVLALVRARLGHVDEAMVRLSETMSAIERAPRWAPTYPAVVGDAIEVAWFLDNRQHARALEFNLQEKVLQPDFRWPGADPRLSMARLCALRNRWDEAMDWFGKARAVLDEQGQRPLRAVVDHDEALMYLRRAAHHDHRRALPLLDAALAQFHSLGMPGWIRRAEALQRQCQMEALGSRKSVPSADSVAPQQAIPAAVAPGSNGVFQLEGEYWTIGFEGKVVRLKDAAGLRYLAHLLRHASVEFHALDLVATLQSGSRERTGGSRVPASDAGPVLDPAAKAAYKRRLAELGAEVDEAERANDPGREARARAELDVLARELAAAVGLGGRDRRAASDAERARLAITQRVKAAIKRIAGLHPGLGRHLATSVRTGTFCVYSPDTARPVDWLL